MRRGLPTGVAGTCGHVARRLSLTAGALVVAGVLIVPSSAWAAESGEPCKAVSLTNNQICYNPSGYHSSMIETESWNSNGTGHGSCTGVLNTNGGLNIEADKCSTNGSGYREAYCTSACNGLGGYGFVWNTSGSTSYFTAWDYWR